MSLAGHSAGANPSGRVSKQVGNPIKMSDTHEDSFTAPPLLGADTEQVLKALLNKTDEEIQILRTEGVI